MSRPNGTLRAVANTETKTCQRCHVTKDVINFHPYWYQPKRNGQKFGDKVHKRTANCYDCRVKTYAPPKLRYFSERSDTEKIANDAEWGKVHSKMVLLNTCLSVSTDADKIFERQIKAESDYITIVGVRFPSAQFMLENKTLKKLINGTPIGTKKWLPEEIWIYCPE